MGRPARECGKHRQRTPSVTSSRVLDAVGGLKPMERAVIALHYWFDLTLRDVAATLDVAQGSIASLQSRSVRRRTTPRIAKTRMLLRWAGRSYQLGARRQGDRWGCKQLARTSESRSTSILAGADAFTTSSPQAASPRPISRPEVSRSQTETTTWGRTPRRSWHRMTSSSCGKREATGGGAGGRRRGEAPGGGAGGRRRLRAVVDSA
jgi:hypothetical protein